MKKILMEWEGYIDALTIGKEYEITNDEGEISYFIDSLGRKRLTACGEWKEAVSPKTRSEEINKEIRKLSAKYAELREELAKINGVDLSGYTTKEVVGPTENRHKGYYEG